MGVFAGIEAVRLVYPLADRAVWPDMVDCKGTRLVIGSEQIFAFPINAGVDRMRRQVLGLTMGSQHPCGRIDAERMREVFVAGGTRTTTAGHDVKILFRRMRPRVLNVT